MLPVLELRGGLIASALLGVDFLSRYLFNILGNVIPIHIVLLFLEKIFDFLKKFKSTERFVNKIEKIMSKKDQIEKYGYWRLLLFVGIPLPGTVAWTGAGLAVLLHLDKRSLLFVFF